MKLKREILEAQDVRAAHELADILLKIHPEKNSDIVQEKAQERLLISLILASSEQGETCAKFLRVIEKCSYSRFILGLGITHWPIHTAEKFIAQFCSRS
jgi:hypothetical protein